MEILYKEENKKGCNIGHKQNKDHDKAEMIYFYQKQCKTKNKKRCRDNC